MYHIPYTTYPMASSEDSSVQARASLCHPRHWRIGLCLGRLGTAARKGAKSRTERHSEICIMHSEGSRRAPVTSSLQASCTSTGPGSLTMARNGPELATKLEVVEAMPARSSCQGFGSCFQAPPHLKGTKNYTCTGATVAWPHIPYSIYPILHILYRVPECRM